MAIWLRAREEFADNRFQLLFIYIDEQRQPAFGELPLLWRPVKKAKYARWHSYDGASTTYIVRTVHGSPYTFSVKPKWRTVVFWFFAARSSAEAYLRTSPP